MIDKKEPSYNFNIKGEGLVFGIVSTEYNNNASDEYESVAVPDLWNGRKVACILLPED